MAMRETPPLILVEQVGKLLEKCSDQSHHNDTKGQGHRRGGRHVQLSDELK
jgi:hypothetical protein